MIRVMEFLVTFRTGAFHPHRRMRANLTSPHSTEMAVGTRGPDMAACRRHTAAFSTERISICGCFPGQDRSAAREHESLREKRYAVSEIAL